MRKKKTLNIKNKKQKSSEEGQYKTLNTRKHTVQKTTGKIKVKVKKIGNTQLKETGQQT